MEDQTSEIKIYVACLAAYKYRLRSLLCFVHRDTVSAIRTFTDIVPEAPTMIKELRRNFEPYVCIWDHAEVSYARICSRKESGVFLQLLSDDWPTYPKLNARGFRTNQS